MLEEEGRGNVLWSLLTQEIIPRLRSSVIDRSAIYIFIVRKA
jgi:hypothetical protein